MPYLCGTAAAVSDSRLDELSVLIERGLSASSWGAFRKTPRENELAHRRLADPEGARDGLHFVALSM